MFGKYFPIYQRDTILWLPFMPVESVYLPEDWGWN